MRALPIRPKTFQQLGAESRPSVPGQPEQIAGVLYDTQLYTSGTTTRMRFFQTTNNDATITNMELAGALPSPQYFIWFDWGLDILIDASASGAGADETGAVDDIAKLVLVSRAIATFNISNKDYGRVPLSFLHASGGPVGFMAATLTAPESIQYANNGVFDGGWSWNGSILIPPNTGFRIDVEFAAAQTLNAGNVNLRMWMRGLTNRKVL